MKPSTGSCSTRGSASPTAGEQLSAREKSKVRAARSCRSRSSSSSSAASADGDVTQGEALALDLHASLVRSSSRPLL